MLIDNKQKIMIVFQECYLIITVVEDLYIRIRIKTSRDLIYLCFIDKDKKKKQVFAYSLSSEGRIRFENK